jgi:hypothetical protein
MGRGRLVNVEAINLPIPSPSRIKSEPRALKIQDSDSEYYTAFEAILRGGVGRGRRTKINWLDQYSSGKISLNRIFSLFMTVSNLLRVR